METRLVIAYALILVMALAVAAFYFYATRDRRAERRSSRRGAMIRRQARDDGVAAEA